MKQLYVLFGAGPQDAIAFANRVDGTIVTKWLFRNDLIKIQEAMLEKDRVVYDVDELTSDESENLMEAFGGSANISAIVYQEKIGKVRTKTPDSAKVLGKTFFLEKSKRPASLKINAEGNYKHLMQQHGLFKTKEEAAKALREAEERLKDEKLSDEEVVDTLVAIAKAGYSKHVISCNSLDTKPASWKEYRQNVLTFSWMSYRGFGRVEEVMEKSRKKAVIKKKGANNIEIDNGEERDEYEGNKAYTA